MPERTYHDTKSEYALPNDEEEQLRLDKQHRLLKANMEGLLIHAPLPSMGNMEKIIDIGCGTGSVTRELGLRYRSATVYGLDISLNSPIEAGSENCRNIEFVQGDINEIMTDQKKDQSLDSRFRAGTFDYVFSRLLILGMTNWQNYVNHTAELVKPGGWVEMHEANYAWHKLTDDFDFSPLAFAPQDVPVDTQNLSANGLHQGVQDDGPTATKSIWSDVLNAAMRERGMDPLCGSNLATYMHRAGLVNIRVCRYLWPHGKWNGLGAEAAALGSRAKDAAEFYVSVLERIGKGTREGPRIEEACQDVALCFPPDWTETVPRVYYWFYVVAGQKPKG